jgi:capsular exopolysaccharide synthesis family protein
MTDDARLRLTYARDVPREEPHLRDYLLVLRRRWLLVLTVLFLVGVGAAAYILTSTPVYQARVRLLIEPVAADGATPAPGTGDLTDAGRADLETHFQLLQSRALAQATIEQLGAARFERSPGSANLPDGLATAIRREAKAMGRAALAWTSELLGKPVTPVRVNPEATPTQARAVNDFIGRLGVSQVQNSRLVDVSFRDPDPVLAATVVNTLATTYIARNNDTRASAVQETSAWLTGQIDEQRKQVANAEAALQNYRERHDALTIEGAQNIVVQKLADLNTAVTKAKTERVLREAIYRQVSQAANDPRALDSLPAVVSNAFVQQQRAELSTLQREQAQLGEKLGDRHPDMLRVRQAIQTAQDRLRAAVQEVVQSLRNDYEAAVEQENTLARALSQQKGEAQALNRKGIQYAVLEREVESSKQIYDSLLQRARLTAVTGELKTGAVRIVDRATPPEVPIGQGRSQVLLIALLGGLFLAVGLAFFVEYFDNRLKTPEAVETHLRLAPLGAIPHKRRALRPGRRLVDYRSPSPLVESFRRLRANVLFASPDGLKSVVVTSASPGEGKTVIAANLALGLAQAGHRVVLVDADLRRPHVHQLLGLDLEPGLSNLLAQHVPAEQVFHATSVQNLAAVTAGTLPPNPAELIGSPRFTAVLRQLEANADIVVIDTPPVMVVADASILAHQTSGVLFVVDADTTSRHAAQAALDQLERARAHFLGAVLNRVDARLRPYYRASYFRRAGAKQPASVGMH